MVSAMRKLLPIAVVALVSAGSWFAWLAWDTTYYLDPKTGYEAGPYEAWQAIGSGITVIVAVIIAVRFAAPARVAAAAAIGYAIAWGSTEMPGDESGMSGVGLVMILIGVGIGTLVIGSAAHAVVFSLDARRKRGPNQQQ